MIKLLFNNEEIAKFKCSCKQVILSFNNKNIDDWKFIFNNLIIINERLLICTVSITEEDSNILLHLFLNEGDKIPSVALTELSNNQITLYNNLIKCIETSTDLSRIVNKIIFYCEGWNRSDLTIRGEMGENNNTKKCYKITNKHDSKMMFEITWIFEENENDLIESVSVILV